jgi:tetratricopeptide (TPR) repeat protein
MPQTELAVESDQDLGLIKLIAKIAHSYFQKGYYEKSRRYYLRALNKCYSSETFKNSFLAASLLLRIAESSTMRSIYYDFEQCIEQVKQIYLLAKDKDTSLLLNSLIDLSWALCLKGRLDEVRSVNNFINQIKATETDDKCKLI